MELKEGMILDYNTSDSIDPITGRVYGKRVEKVLVEDIKGNRVTLYNYSTGKRERYDKSQLAVWVRFGIYKITNEKG